MVHLRSNHSAFLKVVSLFSFCFDRVDGRCVSEWLEDNFIGSLGLFVGLDLPVGCHIIRIIGLAPALG